MGFLSWEGTEVPWEVPRSDSVVSPPVLLTHTRVCLCAQVCEMGVRVQVCLSVHVRVCRCARVRVRVCTVRMRECMHVYECACMCMV